MGADRPTMLPKRVGSAASASRMCVGASKDSAVLTGTDLIERELGGRIIQELDSP
jgi:hypothetical protein